MTMTKQKVQNATFSMKFLHKFTEEDFEQIRKDHDNEEYEFLADNEYFLAYLRKSNDFICGWCKGYRMHIYMPIEQFKNLSKDFKQSEVKVSWRD